MGIGNTHYFMNRIPNDLSNGERNEKGVNFTVGLTDRRNLWQSTKISRSSGSSRPRARTLQRLGFEPVSKTPVSRPDLGIG